MSKANRRINRRRSETGALRILEEAFHLVRSLDLQVFWIYYLGAIPFSLGLLYFVADMSRSSLAGRDAAFAALVMAALTFWLRFCQAKFCAGLWDTINPGQGRRQSRFDQFTCVVALWLLQGFQIPLIIIGLFFAIPLGWILATLQNFSVLALTQDHDRRPLRNLLGKSIRLSHYEWAQNHGILLIFFFVSVFTWVNIVVTCILVPGLGKSFFGIESVFTISPMAAVMNTTFLLGSFLLMNLVILPLVHAAYVLRCFYAESRTSGADLLNRLAECRERREKAEWKDRGGLTKVATIGLLIAVLNVGSAFSEEGVSISERPALHETELLRGGIAETLEQKKYQWQLSRRDVETELTGEKSWIARRLEEIARSAEKAIKAAEKWFEEMMRKLMERGMTRPDADDGSASRFFKSLGSSTSIALVVIILGLLLWLTISLYRKHRDNAKLEVNDEGASGMIDLSSEDIVATQLHEDEWLRLAREQMEKGEERLAVRALFLATLAHLGERGLLKIAKFKSNRDYRSELVMRAKHGGVIRAAFEENTTLFERVWYGLHRLGEGSVDHYLENHETIARESLKSAARPPLDMQ